MIKKNKLKKIREKMGISQEKLAMDMNTSQKNISSWEVGRTTPSASRMQYLEEYFEVPKEVIFFEAFNYKNELKLPNRTEINSNTESDRAGQLQYVKVGPLCHIFGTVKNLSTIKSGGEIVVATMPPHLSVKTMDRTVCQGSSNDTFACTAYGSAQPFPNQITITRTRDGGGKNIDFTSGKWLNISLTIRV
ncbi:hypothetical protein TEHN7128_1610 [Tetragenococcus halophilus subsp. halophilus]|nr:helix-turn-helix transcriptional regulator [Tetragenococcus halophilus]GBD66037.1 hypothetical protein TEHN7116_1001 [Tetragenococcus halophilus subsp. halophilus]GBD78381.1 hypothetical protein TEHN7128_1610 [Tetragenococcus halophilus subsp. halophilus]